MPWTKGEKPLNPEDTTELFGSIRDIALDEMEEGLRSLGVAQADINKARAECIAQNSDKPFMELMKGNAKYQEQFKRMFG